MSKIRLSILLAAGTLAACSGDGTRSSADSVPGGGGPQVVAPASARVASIDSVANAPNLLWALRTSGAGTAAATRPADAVEAARQHVASFASYYRLAPGQAADLELHDLHDTGRGLIIARFGRHIDGIEVLGEQISVAMDRTLEAVALTGYVTGDLPAAAKIRGKRARDAFTLGEARAVTAAMSDLSGARLDASDFDAPIAATGSYQNFRLRPAGALRANAAARVEPSRVKPVFFRPAAGALVPAYYVEADLGNDAANRPRAFAYLIAADGDRVLARNDLTARENPITYRVYADSSGLFTPWDGPQSTGVTPHPTGTPDGFQPELVPAQLVTLSSLTAVGVNDPWLPPGATETLGNNVDAYLDLSNPDGFTQGSNDFRGTMSSANTFDYAFDTGLDADANLTQRQAAVTQLFYDINWFHDWYYAAGFTETAGNAQFSNYGRGGIEGDGLRAEAQDSSGFNDANMLVPADGGRPRMQVYLWSKSIDLGVTVTEPAELAGELKDVGTAAFGPTTFSLTGQIVRADPVDACAPLVGDYAGKIVFVDRGCTTFAEKAERVQAAGGIGVIIANVPTSPNPGVPPLMGGVPTVPITIGALSLGLADGDRFRAAFNAGAAVRGQIASQSLLLDGDIDNQLVAHEWGHYISSRLIFDARGLDTNMALGLWEGWADFHAMLMTVREEDTENPLNDDWQGAYGLGGYADSGDPNSYYFGIRRYPYSTDLARNPLTFKHISDMNPLPAIPAPNFIFQNSEVHGTGEVWAAMLWECYASLLRETLGTSPRLTFAEARDRMRDYLVAAYKLTPANPTLLEARDALLLAALGNDPVDYDLFGRAFAKRGAGVNAIAPPRGENTNTPVVESYAWAPSVRQTGAALVDDLEPVCSPDNILDDNEVGTLRVTFENTGIADTPELTAEVSSTTPGIRFPDGSTLLVPALDRNATGEAEIRVAASGIAPNTPIHITVTTPDAGSGELAPVTYGFSGDADELAGHSAADTAERSISVWTVGSSSPVLPSESLWQVVRTSSDNRAYGCRSAALTALVALTSPPFSVPVGATLGLSFRHRHSFENDQRFNFNFDAGVIEVSTDGVTWVDISSFASTVPYNGQVFPDDPDNPLRGRNAFTGTSAGYPAFSDPISLTLGTGFGGQLVRIRFVVGSDASVASPGWEIDDIQISGTTVPLFPGLIANSDMCNRQPIANAGVSQTIAERGPGPAFALTTVFLDGSASIDPNGDPLTYQWTQIAGPAVTLTSETARAPSFTAPEIPRTPGSAQLTFQLVVSDGIVNSAAKLSSVTVVNSNRPPIANAGPPQSVAEGTEVTLDGTASADPDAADPPLNYTWTAPPGIRLSSTTAAHPTFVAPEVTTDTPLTFTLVVSDGLSTSAPSQVTITVLQVNEPPVAHAGPDLTVRSFDLVFLHGSGSDPDGAIASFRWTASPGIVLFGARTPTPFFIAPKVNRTTVYTVSLVVTDSSGLSSAPDTAIIAVRKR